MKSFAKNGVSRSKSFQRIVRTIKRKVTFVQSTPFNCTVGDSNSDILLSPIFVKGRDVGQPRYQKNEHLKQGRPKKENAYIAKTMVPTLQLSTRLS